MINVGKSKIGIKSLGIRKEEKTSNGDTSNVFEHHQGNLYVNSSLRSVSCPGNPRAGPATFLDGNPILAPHLRGYPYGTDARCLRALTLLKERGASLAGLEAARRDATPETPNTTACTVDFLILTPPGIGRGPLHYCRRDMDG